MIDLTYLAVSNLCLPMRRTMIYRSGKLKNPQVLIRLAVLGIAGIALVVSGSRALQIHSSNKRIAGEPVPLEPSPQNKGKRCEAKNYWTLNADDEPQRDKIDLEWYRQCYHLQERLINAASEGNLEQMRLALREGANADGTFDDSYP